MRKKNISPLTGRETQILYQLVDGDTRREIALQWGVSVITIQNHIRMTHARLNCNTTLEAIAIAVRSGWVK